MGGGCKERLGGHVQVPQGHYERKGKDYGQGGLALEGRGVRIKLQMGLGRGVAG